jgi:chemotaxis signal transduction protein
MGGWMPAEGDARGAPSPNAASGAGAVRHLLARRGPLWVGFEVSQVLEVFPLDAPARVPRAPAWLVGVVQHQGRPLPVVDLARIAGVSAPAPAHLAVLLDHAEVPLVVVAEAVEVVSDATPDTESEALDLTGQSDACRRLAAQWQVPGDGRAVVLCAPGGKRFHPLAADRVVEIVMGAATAGRSAPPAAPGTEAPDGPL